MKIERGKHTSRDTLHTTTTSKTTDRRLRDTLDVVTKNLAMTLGSTLPKTLATFSTCKDALAQCHRAREARSSPRLGIEPEPSAGEVLTSSHDEGLPVDMRLRETMVERK
jgi:hypothetical protein